MTVQAPRLYAEFADWYHLLSASADFAEDAHIYLDMLADAAASPPRSLLELGVRRG